MKQFFFAANILFFFCFSARAVEEAGSIASVKGRVLISRPLGKSRNQFPAEVGKPIYVGDEFTSAAGAHAQVSLKGGHAIHMTPGTFWRLAFLRFDETTDTTEAIVKVLYGKIKVDVRSGAAPKPTFFVHTPNAVIGVRGTEFWTTYSPQTHTTQLQTLKGEVQLQSAAFSQKGKEMKTSEPSMVRAGQQSSVTSGRAASDTPRLTPPETIDNAVLNAQEEELLDAPPPPPEAEKKLEELEHHDAAISFPYSSHIHFFTGGGYVYPMGSSAGPHFDDKYLHFDFGVEYLRRKPKGTFGWGGILNAGLYQNKTYSVNQFKGGLGALLGLFFDNLHLLFRLEGVFLTDSGMSADWLAMGFQLGILVGYEFPLSTTWSLGVRGGGELDVWLYIKGVDKAKYIGGLGQVYIGHAF